MLIYETDFALIQTLKTGCLKNCFLKNYLLHDITEVMMIILFSFVFSEYVASTSLTRSYTEFVWKSANIAFLFSLAPEVDKRKILRKKERASFDQEKSKIQEKRKKEKKENKISTKKKKKENKISTKKRSKFKICLFSFINSHLFFFDWKGTSST